MPASFGGDGSFVLAPVKSRPSVDRHFPKADPHNLLLHSFDATKSINRKNRRRLIVWKTILNIWERRLQPTWWTWWFDSIWRKQLNSSPIFFFYLPDAVLIIRTVRIKKYNDVMESISYSGKPAPDVHIIKHRDGRNRQRSLSLSFIYRSFLKEGQQQAGIMHDFFLCVYLYKKIYIYIFIFPPWATDASAGIVLPNIGGERKKSWLFDPDVYADSSSLSLQLGFSNIQSKTWSKERNRALYGLDDRV